uniref:7TM GPCR serpentine receptor class x (Srx) domain-containing protein n=1 Tax=Panagrolaimus sp. JU765 TaxID=591449 RepID=A0AC34RCD0_9BILA
MTITTIQIYNEADGIAYVSQIGFGLGTLHSTMNCIMMLVMISPYRQVITNYFCFLRSKRQISSDSNNMTSFHQRPTEIVKDKQTETGLSHAAYLG